MRINYFISFLCFFILCAVWVTPASALEVRSIRFGEYPNKTRVVLDLDQATEFRAFTMNNPARIVLDMPSFFWKNVHLEHLKSSSIIATRSGPLTPSITRVVFELNGYKNLSAAYILPQEGEKPTRLVLDLAQSNEEKFTKALNKKFGKLDESSSTIATAPSPSTAPPSQNDVENSDDIKMVYEATTNNAKAFPVQVKERLIAPKPPPGAKPVSTQAPLPAAKPTAADPKAAPPSMARKPVIIIDPGHGGNDPGATSHEHHFEKNVVLDLSKQIKKQLEQTGRYQVILTREDDRYIRLHERVKFAQRQKADLFISIHADSLPQSQDAHGASFYTLSDTASDAQTAKLAEKENKSDLIAGVDLSQEDEEVADILLDLVRRDTMNQSKFFANTLVNVFKGNNVGILENPHRSAGFAVLKAPEIPSVLIEAGFLSNPTEAELLLQEDHRTKLAQTISSGVDQYFTIIAKKQQL